MNKSPDAFRTISEVADLLETPAHVLRFWESRFPQIRPVKRAGGRRYYRPADVALLSGIKRLLHDEGMTIRGVQKILREQGVRHVSGMSDDTAEAEDDAALAAALAQVNGVTEPAPPLPPAEAETAQIIALQAALKEPVAEVSDLDATDDLTATEDDAWAIDVSQVSIEPEDKAGPVEVSAPQMVSDRPVDAAPVVADLFAQDALLTHARSDEAPMVVWASDADVDVPGDQATDAPDRPSAPVLKITRIGAVATTAPSAPVALTVATAEVGTPDATQTLAQRLRALSPEVLAADDQAQFALIRDRAMALRARLAGPARAQG